MARFRTQLMKPAKNSFLSRYGRYVTLGVTVAAFAGLVTFLHWRHEQHNARVSPALNGVASQMRNDASAWSHHDQDVAAIGVSPNAILVATRDGAKYFVTDHNATFSNALLLGDIKADARSR